MLDKKNVISLLVLIVTGFFALGYINNNRSGHASPASNGLALGTQSPETLRDAVANSAAPDHAPGLSLQNDNPSELHDAVAASPALGPGRSNDVQNGGQNAGPASPRGTTDFPGGGPGSHPGSELPQNHPAPQNVSPSGPPQP